MLAMRRADDDETAEGARVIPISERLLFERYRGGEREAFAPLVHAWRARVFGYLTRCGVPAADRDDLFQEVFLRIHRAALRVPVTGHVADELAPSEEAPESGSLVPWMMTITVNVVRSHFRKATVRSVVSLEERAGDDVPAPTRGPEAELTTRETAQWMERAIAALPLEQREALVLSAIDGMEIAEVARVVGAPAETVKTRVRRARLALADARARRALVAEREEGA
jgi:RNA polymerase sigma-70 factor (ECF subfamily)